MTPQAKRAVVEHMRQLMRETDKHGGAISVCAGCFVPREVIDNLPWVLEEFSRSLRREAAEG